MQAVDGNTISLEALARKLQFPNWMRFSSESDIEKIVLGFLLQKEKPERESNIRIVAFEHQCFLQQDGNLCMSKCRVEDFPIISLAENHYVLNSPNSLTIESVLERFLACHGFMKEYRKIPSDSSSPKAFKEIISDCQNLIRDNYRPVADKVVL